MYDLFFIIYDNDYLKTKIRSRFPLAKFCIANKNTNMQELLQSAQKRSLTKMFWVVNLNYEIKENFKFDYEVTIWHQKYVHVFKEESLGNHEGVFLIPKNMKITNNEAKYMFFINKIELDIVASILIPIPYDIVFISYDESNADKNYQNLIERFPRAKRIHGVKGIHQAHKEAATIVETPMFWVVDGDAEIVEDFNFDYQVPARDLDVVHVWRSKNPINDLEYGYGGVKLLPTQLTKDLDINSVDMTTSISSKFKSLPEVSNISKFNTNEFNTWRSAFRECVKLSSNIIMGQVDSETLDRLETWCNKGGDREYGMYAILGANMGKEYGLKHKDDPDMLAKINDWNWLINQFKINKLV